MLNQRSLLALSQGFKLCLFDSAIRKLAMWPWLISAGVYLIVATAAFFSHGPMVDWLVPNPEGFLKWALYYLAWIGSALFLVVSTLVTSLVLAIVLTGVFQANIAQEVLKQNGVALPEEPAGIGGFVVEMTRSIKTESVKLFWLVPLGILVLLMGFAPFLAPIAFIIAAWILAFESTDVVWEALKKPTKERFSFAKSNWIPLVIFGLTLSAVGLIPFMGILLPPIAVAGASWLLVDTIKEKAA